VRTASEVHELVVQNGRVTGVRLSTGQQLSAGTVLATCSPKLTLDRMLPGGVLPDRLASRAAHIPTSLAEAASLKIDVALSGRVSLPRHQAWRKDGLDLRQPIISWQTYEEHVAAWDDVVGRRWPDPIPFIGIVPTALDPTQAPAGQDTFWVWSGIVPVHPHEPWSEVRDEIGNKVLGEAARYYEGLDGLEIGRRIMSAPDLEERFRAPDGNVYHVDPIALRFGPLRPAWGFGGYKTPVPGLYLSGAGTHPTGGISGIPGQVAARTLNNALRRGERRLPRRPKSPYGSNGDGRVTTMNGAGAEPAAAPVPLATKAR
jgi:phytoene dehydrogenase-like protein